VPWVQVDWPQQSVRLESKSIGKGALPEVVAAAPAEDGTDAFMAWTVLATVRSRTQGR
jgi:hypothetical protein